MASHTFTTTAVQDAALARYLVTVNAQRESDGQARYADVAAFVAARVAALLTPIVKDYADEQAEAVRRAFLAADTDAQAAVKDALKL